MDQYLRYVSVCALVISPDRRRLLIGYRNMDDKFHPGEPAFPGGRVSGSDSLEDTIMSEISQEADVKVDRSTLNYIGECSFEREGYPVTQVCFAIKALDLQNTADTRELHGLKWLMPVEFFSSIADTGYFKNYHRFVSIAIDKGYLNYFSA